MRSFAWVLIAVVGWPWLATAQEPPAESVITTVATPPAVAPPAFSNPAPLAPPAVAFSTPSSPRLTVSAEMGARWHRGRVLYGLGSYTGLLGSGLTLSSVLVVAITGYPCNPDDPLHSINPNPNDSCSRNSPKYDPPSPTDPVPLLSYIGSSVSALGFVFSAAGLGSQHLLLSELQADTGRGIFAGGTTLGLLGFVSVGFSYFFGLTNYLSPHDQGVAIFASSLTGTVLCFVGGILYTADASRMKKVWQRLSSF